MGKVSRRGARRRGSGTTYFLPPDVSQQEWERIFKPAEGVLEPEASISYHRKGENVFLIEQRHARGGEPETSTTPVRVKRLTEDEKVFFRSMTDKFEELMSLGYHQAHKRLRGFLASQSQDNVKTIASLTSLFWENRDTFFPGLDKREGGDMGYLGESLFGAENDVYLATGLYGVGAGFLSVKYEDLKRDGTTRPSEMIAHIKTVLRSKEFKGTGLPDLLLSQWTRDVDESGRQLDEVWTMIRADNKPSRSMMTRWGLRLWRMRTGDMPGIPESEGGHRTIAYMKGSMDSIREYVKRLESS